MDITQARTLFDQPYFPVQPQQKNLQRTRQLRPCYAGKNGALTAHLQYFYHSKYMAQPFARMSEVKLYHLHQLADLLLVYGGAPHFYQSTTQGSFPWSMGYLSTATDAPLRHALRAEQVSAQQLRALLPYFEGDTNLPVLEQMLAEVQELMRRLEALLATSTR